MQSKQQSLIEAVVNVSVGFCLSFAASFLFLPMFGYSTPNMQQAFGITLCYTLLAIFRNYGLRRLFNRFTKRKIPNDYSSL